MVKKPTIKYLDRNGDYQYATVKDIGDIDELLTPIKTDLVSAINAIIEDGLGGGGELSQEWIDYINGIGSDLEDVMNSIDAGIFSPAQLAEIQEAIDYARTEIERLLSIDYTEKFDQIREEYDEKVQEINNNVDGVTNNLEAARESLESVREHLSNVELNVTTVTESVDYVKGELSTKVDSTTFELLESTVNDNSTEILQNAEEIRLKASQDSLDLATQDIQQLQADFSVTAEAIEGTVKKSELVGELEGLDIYPPTLLRGSRDWWEWESTIPARAYVKSETYQHASIQEQVGFNAYLTKELTDLEIGKTYVASIWIKSEATHAKPVFKIGSTNHFMKNNNTSDEFLSNIWQRYSVSFVADKEIVIVGYTTTETVSGDVVQFAGGKVEIGTKSTGWREHEDDNHNRLVVAETTVRQTAEGIAQIAQRQTEIDGEIEEQQTQLNQTSEKIDLQADKLTQHGEDITEMSAQLTVQADMIKSKVSQTDINKSIGDIKLDNRNGILNSDFSQDFDNWSGISSVFKVVKIGNKNYAQASRTGLTGDVISTISSNMIQAKNGQRIMIGMDMIVENVNIYDTKIPFVLDMFDINDVRVSHKYFTAQEMGVTFQNGVAQRVSANYEINREDVAKVQLRLTLYRNGTVSYTNITLQRGDIGSTDWSPAPEDAQAITAKLSTEIIQTADKIEAKADKSIVDKLTGDMSTMNATIEAQAEQIGLRVTKTEAQGYAKDAIDGVTIGGANLLRNSNFSTGSNGSKYWSNNAGAYGTITIGKVTIASGATGVGIFQSNTAEATIQGETYTVSAYVKGTGFIRLGFSGASENQPVTSADEWKQYSVTVTRPASGAVIFYSGSRTSSLEIKNVQLERGNKVSDWSPAIEDTENKIVALDAQIKIESDKITQLVTKVDGQDVYINEITQTADRNAALIADHTGALSMITQKVDAIDLSVVKKDKIIAGINASTEKDGTGTLRLKGDRILIDGNTSFKSDLIMDGGIIRSKDNGINIDLNKGEMNLGKPLTINAKPVATKEDLSSLEQKYEGQSLLDKTEILSGTEIYTDKADDSVVHVEVDGKSYQNSKDNSKNIAPNPEYWEYSSGASYDSKTKEITIPVNGRAVFWVKWDGALSPARLILSPSSGSGFLWNTEYYAENKTTRVYENSNSWTGNGMVIKWDGDSFVGVSTTPILNSGVKWIKMYLSGNPTHTPSTVKIKNIALRSDTSNAYEPPAPTPDYPIAINSLNNFDVVSSVGKENLAINTGNMATFYVYKSVATKELIDDNKSPSGKALKIKVATTDPSGHIFYIPIADLTERKLEKGVKYTASFFMKASKHISLKLNQVNQASILDGFSGVLSKEYELISFNFIPTVSGNDAGNHNAHFVFPNIDANGLEFYITPLKIEKSESPSLWNDSPSDISYDTRTETIYKTKLQLSEPLRSVGDVKDRLFRDSDGLWKIERNVGEVVFDGTESWQIQTDSQYGDGRRFQTTVNNSLSVQTRNTILSSHFSQQSNELADKAFQHGSRIFIYPRATVATSVSALKSWLASNNVTFLYQLETQTTETLPQVDQDKLNSIVSYKDSNYVYTIVDKTNILPSYVRENLKPNLRATFKGGGWYSRWKTEQGFNQTNKSVDSLKNETIPALKDGLLNSSEKEAVRQSLNVVSADKKGIDTQFTTVYANTALVGTAKTNLNNAKVALNTAFANLQSAINAVLVVGDGTRITATQMTLVTTRLNEYGTALSTYNQRYEQAQDAISTEKKRLGDAYALAQATLAETQAKAHADGKITAEEERAIADAQAKLDEAKSYVDALEIGGRNLLKRTSDTPREIDASIWYRIINEWRTEYTPISEIGLEVGDTFTYSIYIDASQNTTFGGQARLTFYSNASGANRVSATGVMIPAGKKGYSTITYTLSSLNTYMSVAINNSAGGTTPTETLLYSKAQVEKGNKATDWTPAPEDIQTEIDNKANQEDLGSVEGSLNDLYTIVNDLDVQTIKDQLAEYQGVLSSVKSDSDEAKDQLERILSEENGALAIINTILDEFNQRWTTLDGFIEINGSETALSINKGNTNMVIDSDSLTFYSGGSPVATITNQYMKIDRGIFVESMHIGRHQWAPLQSNKDHFVLSYVGDAPL